MSAARALIEMTAERGRATPRDGQQHFDMLPADPLTASFDEGVSRGADQIGHLEGWPAPSTPSGGGRSCSSSESSGLAVAFR